MEQEEGNFSIVDTEKAPTQVILENKYYSLSRFSSCRENTFSLSGICCPIKISVLASYFL